MVPPQVSNNQSRIQASLNLSSSPTPSPSPLNLPRPLISPRRTFNLCPPGPEEVVVMLMREGVTGRVKSKLKNKQKGAGNPALIQTHQCWNLLESTLPLKCKTHPPNPPTEACLSSKGPLVMIQERAEFSHLVFTF